MHRIALKSRVRLEAPRHLLPGHLLSSQYLCGSSQPDTCHVVHEVSVQDTQGNWFRVKALIDCGATSIFASPFYWENLTSSVLRLRIFTVKVIYFLKYQSPPVRTFRHNHKTEKSAQADSLPHQSKKVRPGGLSATTTKAKKSACADFPPQPPK
jgi:hypothetical protein